MCIQELCEIDTELKDTLNILCQEGLQFASEQDFNTFLSLYQELNNHTRKCLNRGYTPAELLQMAPIAGQMTLFEDD